MNLFNYRKYVENPVFRDDQIFFLVESDKMYIYQDKLHDFNSLKTYTISHRALLQKIKKIFTFGSPAPLMGHPRYGLIWSKKIFFKFCYLIHVEHEKCSEMCVLIARFGQN